MKVPKVFPTLPISLTQISIFSYFSHLQLRLGAQSVTLLSTLRDPTQLRRRQCATRQQPQKKFPYELKTNQILIEFLDSTKKSPASRQKKFPSRQKKFP